MLPIPNEGCSIPFAVELGRSMLGEHAHHDDHMLSPHDPAINEGLGDGAGATLPNQECLRKKPEDVLVILWFPHTKMVRLPCKTLWGKSPKRWQSKTKTIPEVHEAVTAGGGRQQQAAPEGGIKLLWRRPRISLIFLEANARAH